MVSIHIDNVGEMAVVECEGRFVRSDAAFKLRDAVTSQAGASMVVLDLTEVNAMGGGGIGNADIELACSSLSSTDLVGLNSLNRIAWS